VGQIISCRASWPVLMCGSTIRWGKPWGRTRLGTAQHCSQQLA
jgi:hypothetical protein